ncbi:hypothetical protein CA223_05010 [Sphingomonas koreensis]|jgi:hypothetical protein|uniref:Uncharacterized protein n=1 Tax=Sphingomonas koreensis TaxID=93064 RepID=A0A1L6JBH7_9SPHN|nr:hypothetical protein [Sphingomonas koreensis]APR53279.1 hypothetical protein BRX40_13355 [Sphingomonas koreensis]RSU24597.1 hypothetical protein CA224_02470 [Sphingomonas koreensis]RSU27133.1 hypothetical protein CA222_08980 [Sphingomonas koreensis]RSU30081.1 hypothetical protein CA225_05285 [Sphingomonas koreensis]RSU32968.1 hypothetical protein BRX39_14810 [Sphingomonas koreensis]
MTGGFDLRRDEVGAFINLKAFADHMPFWKAGAILPKYQEIRRSAPHLFHSGDPSAARPIFITHRWDDRGHPDPTGWQLRALLNLGRHYNYQNPDICFWYDYMSLPQKRRTAADRKLFQRGLSNIRRTVGRCANISLISRTGSSHEDDLAAMLERGWILFELYIARRNMKASLPVFERSGGTLEHGRMNYYGWDDIVPELSTMVAPDSREAIHQWFLSKGITCTNGSDLAYLAALLQEELSRYDSDLPPPGIEFDQPVDFSAGQIARYAFVNGSNLSHRFPNLFIEDLTFYQTGSGEARWRGVARKRPAVPALDLWLAVAQDEAKARMVAAATGRSPMYPGLHFAFRKAATGGLEMLVTLTP